MIIRTQQIVTLNIIYYMPDYHNLLQEFIWSCDDWVPELERTHKFLWHWKNNVDAVIKEIVMGINQRNFHSYTNVDEILNLN